METVMVYTVLVYWNKNINVDSLAKLRLHKRGKLKIRN